MAHSSHFFIALPLPLSVRHELARIREQLATKYPFRSWVHEEDYHITFVFLGAVEDHSYEILCQKLEMMTAEATPFSLSLHGLGSFGRPDQPRILWAGLKKSQPLFEVQKQTARICEQIGFSIDQRAYSPHITLARRWKGKERKTVKEMEQDIESLSPMTWEANELVIFKTHLDRKPKYEAVARFPFQE